MKKSSTHTKERPATHTLKFEITITTHQGANNPLLPFQFLPAFVTEAMNEETKSPNPIPHIPLLSPPDKRQAKNNLTNETVR